MPKFGSQIDAQRIPIKGLVPEQGTAFPASPTEGLLFHRTDLKQFYIYLNAGWVRCDASGTAAAVHIHAIADVTGLQAALDAKDTAIGTKLDATTRLDQIAAPTAPVNLNSQRLTGVADPVAGTDAANKQYVDNMAAGLDAKQSVKWATTSNIATLSGAIVLDGTPVAPGDRILVKDQTTASTNGIYIGASGAWTRATDFDSAADVTPGAYVFVESGVQNADTGWVLTTDGAITVGTTSLNFTQFSGAAALIAGTGLTKTGNTVNAVGTANRITVLADSIDIASNYAGQNTISTLGTVTIGTWSADAIALNKGGTGGTNAASARANLVVPSMTTVDLPAMVPGTWTLVTHSLGTLNPDVSFTEVATSETVILDWKKQNTNQVYVRSDIGYAASAITASFQG